MPPGPPDSLSSFLQLAVSDGTPKRSAIVALVIGSLLVGINQGDALIAGSGFSVWKAVLTYCVPYCVATWGAVDAKRQFAKASVCSDARQGP